MSKQHTTPCAECRARLERVEFARSSNAKKILALLSQMDCMHSGNHGYEHRIVQLFSGLAAKPGAPT